MASKIIIAHWREEIRELSDTLKAEQRMGGKKDEGERECLSKLELIYI